MLKGYSGFQSQFSMEFVDLKKKLKFAYIYFPNYEISNLLVHYHFFKKENFVIYSDRRLSIWDKDMFLHIIFQYSLQSTGRILRLCALKMTMTYEY